MLEFILVLVIVVLLAFPLGKYLACIMQNREMKIDPIFNWIEKPIYRVLGTHPDQGMNAKTYSLSFVASCIVIGLVTWLLFMCQASLPLNPNNAPNMSWDLALHTMISFHQYQPTALFRSSATVIFITDGWYCWIANHYANDGLGNGGCNRPCLVLSAVECFVRSKSKPKLSK